MQRSAHGKPGGNNQQDRSGNNSSMNIHEWDYNV
jgi:hypothetical protein